MKDSKEVMQALLDYKVLINRRNDLTAWLGSDGVFVFSGEYYDRITADQALAMLFGYYTDWEIVEPSKRYATTMDKAIKAKRIRIRTAHSKNTYITVPKYMSIVDEMVLSYALTTPGATIEIVED